MKVLCDIVVVKCWVLLELCFSSCDKLFASFVAKAYFLNLRHLPNTTQIQFLKSCMLSESTKFENYNLAELLLSWMPVCASLMVGRSSTSWSWWDQWSLNFIHAKGLFAARKLESCATLASIQLPMCLLKENFCFRWLRRAFFHLLQSPDIRYHVSDFIQLRSNAELFATAKTKALWPRMS